MMRTTMLSLTYVALLAAMAVPAVAGQYLVKSKGGPVGAATTPQETIKSLEDILPSFDAIIKLQADKKILAGGIPIGSRSWIFIVEASSTDAVDKLIRDLPLWFMYNWKVVPLQSFDARAKMERSNLKALKK